MKTIIETTTNLSKYLVADDVEIAVSADIITVGNPAEFIIADLNSSNSVVYEGVTAPTDWVGNKYMFDGTNWTLDPNWVDPALEQ